MRLIVARSLPVRLLMALFVACGLAGAAQATCTISSPTPTFAPGSTYDVKSGSVAAISSPAGLACTGSVLNVLGTSYANATMTSANNFVLVGSNGGSIPFKVSADQGATKTFTQGGTINYMSTTLLSLLNILSPNSLSPQIYLALTASPNIPAGTYTDTLTVQWSYSVCNGVNLLGIACVSYESGTGTSTIKVTLVVSADCRISAPDIVFNSAPLASQFPTVSQAVLVDCSTGSSYKVAFTSGGNGSARPWRTMSDGAGHTLQYNIYLPDGTTIWDQSNPQTSTTKGTGSTTPSQMQAYVAKVNAAQTTPPAGSYSDTVNVVITF